MSPWRARRATAGREATPDPDGRPDDGSPVGRRVVLGLLGLGALGIATGTRAQNALTTVLAPDPAPRPDRADLAAAGR